MGSPPSTESDVPRNTGRYQTPRLNCTATNGLDWMSRGRLERRHVDAPFACSRLPFGWARRSSSIEVKSGRISWPFVEQNRAHVRRFLLLGAGHVGDQEALAQCRWLGWSLVVGGLLQCGEGVPTPSFT